MSWCISVKTVGSGDTSTSSIRASTGTGTATGTATAVPAAAAARSGESAKGSPSSPLGHDAAASPSPAVAVASSVDCARARAGGGNINTSSGKEEQQQQQQQQPQQQQPPEPNNGNLSTFTITVEPDSPISCLHSSIEAVTGLAASQQRLIYRGRIIQSAPTSTPTQTQTPPAASSGRSEDDGGGDGDGGDDDDDDSWRHRHRSRPPQSQHSQSQSQSQSQGTSTSSDEERKHKHTRPQPSSERMCIRDVSGLGDGQTIHLVPRPRPAPSSPYDASPSAAAGSPSSTSDSSDGDGGDSSSSTTASLLATLLGLGASSPSAVSPVVVREDPAGSANGNAAEEGTTEDASTLLGLSSLLRRTDLQGRRDRVSLRHAADRRRLVDRRRRQMGPPPRGPGRGRPTPREPGSLEPVRQGLMTLHTMLHHHQNHNGNETGHGAGNEAEVACIGPTGAATAPARATTTTTTTTTTPPPTDARRRFYLGQWVDVRDTVNQWLEATIIDVALPRDVLLQSSESSGTSTCGDGSPARAHVVGRRRRSGEEPIVSADDLPGRRALLLEPPSATAAGATATAARDYDHRGVDDRGLDDDAGSGGEPAGERSGNEHVQLLLVHYNGWPHRWDEWLRSDSERIRPFRTRTVHSPHQQGQGQGQGHHHQHHHAGAQGPHALYASPTVQSVYSDAPSTAIVRGDGDGDERGDERGEGVADRSAVLPEISRAIAGVGRLLSELVQEDEMGNDDGNEHVAAASSTSPVEEKLEEGDVGGDELRATRSTNPGSSDHSHLPWLPSNSRGTRRTNTDEENVRSREESRGYNREALNALAPLLDRLGRTLVDAAPHVVALAASLPCEEGQAQGEEAATASASDSGGYVPSVATHQEAPVVGASASASASSSTTSEEDRDTPNDDDEYADFVNGMVNTRSSHSGRPPSTNSDATGGSASAGLRRNRQNSTDAGSGAGSLLATYLAAASLAGLGLASAGDGNSGSDTNSDNENEGGGGRGGTEGGMGNEDTSGVSALARLLGGGGGNGGNIDIHIHAVVTPGFEPGGLAFAALPPVATAQAVAPPTGSSGNLSSASHATAPAFAPAYMNAVSEEEEDLGLFDELYSGEVQVPSASASSTFNSLTHWSDAGDDDSSPLAVATTASEEGTNQEEEHDIASPVSPDEHVFAPAVGLEPFPRGEEQSMNDESSVDSFHSVHSGNDKDSCVDQCTSARETPHSHLGGSDGGAVAENSFSESSSERIVKRSESNDDANICAVRREEERNNDNLVHGRVAAASSSGQTDLRERGASSRRGSAGQTPSSPIGFRPVTESESPSQTRSGGRRTSRLMRVLRRSVGRR